MRRIFLLPCLIAINSLCLRAQENKKLIISHLADNFYVYTTFRMLNGNPFPSNSMFLVTDSGIVMFDSPWDTSQFQPLLDTFEQKYHKKAALCIATHFHDDRTAGLDFLKSKGVRTYSSKQTYDMCRARNEKQAQFYFVHDTALSIGGYDFETFYGGAGHTSDNIVIWFGKYNILYGGCLVKSMENNGLGNIADANVTEWPKTIKKIMKKYPDPQYVVTGHFKCGDKNTLTHTLKLLKEYEKSK